MLVLRGLRADHVFLELVAPRGDGALARLRAQCLMQTTRATDWRPLHAGRVLRLRLERWRTLASRPPYTRLLPHRGGWVLTHLAHLPAALRWALIRIWLIGVRMAHRFQLNMACRLGGSGHDKVAGAVRSDVVANGAWAPIRVSGGCIVLAGRCGVAAAGAGKGCRLCLCQGTGT